MPVPRLIIVTKPVRDALHLATKDAVNQCALLITTDARRRVQAAIGPEQRMSHVTARVRGDKGGRRVVVSAETIGKGGTRINPAYKQADSVTNPVAVIGARGPAHLIEHRRRGGYEVKPLKVAGASPDIADVFASIKAAQLTAELGLPQGSARRALKVPGTDGRARAHPGPITNPLRPITKAFEQAARTVERAARDELAASMRRRLGVAVR
jgi:hypothetical protein